MKVAPTRIEVQINRVDRTKIPGDRGRKRHRRSRVLAGPRFHRSSCSGSGRLSAA
jgi:hypothetical protein